MQYRPGGLRIRATRLDDPRDLAVALDGIRTVLNASADSRGINQRARYRIDQFAASTAVPYSTIRPAIFSASLR